MENISEDAVLSWPCGEYNDVIIRYIEEKKKAISHILTELLECLQEEQILLIHI